MSMSPAMRTGPARLASMLLPTPRRSWRPRPRRWVMASCPGGPRRRCGIKSTRSASATVRPPTITAGTRFRGCVRSRATSTTCRPSASAVCCLTRCASRTPTATTPPTTRRWTVGLGRWRTCARWWRDCTRRASGWCWTACSTTPGAATARSRRPPPPAPRAPSMPTGTRSGPSRRSTRAGAPSAGTRAVATASRTTAGRATRSCLSSTTRTGPSASTSLRLRASG
mmetsp:Transcript_11509/g.29073  ORF Transcript_11509/g.29073 Transcript_11509/m.29073 type:complete len:226 (+) Transcript_11509:509-1186(+)